MFFLGNITAFAQTNPYIEQIDSVVDSNGNYIDTYAYSSDGSMRLIRSYFDRPDGLYSVVYVEDSDHHLIHEYQYAMDAMGVRYLSGKEDYEYDSEGRVKVKNIYETTGTKLSLTKSIEYDYRSVPNTTPYNITTTNWIDQSLWEKVQTIYDESGRESSITITANARDYADVVPTIYMSYIYVDNDPDIIRIEKKEEGIDLGMPSSVIEKVYYADGSLWVSDNIGRSNPKVLFDDTKYDRYGIMVCDSSSTYGNRLVDKIFSNDGKLIEAARIDPEFSTGYLNNYSYDYFLTDEGVEYYTCTMSSYLSPEELIINRRVIYVPEKVVDGVSVSFHAFNGEEMKCQFFEKGTLVMEAYLKKVGDKIIVCSKDVYTRDKDGDITLVESFAIPSSDAGNTALQLTKRTVYQFDDSVPVSSIKGYRYYDWKKKILSMSYETPKGEEYYRQNYYYTSLIPSDIKLHTASSSRQSGVYDVNGHLINAPKAGKIYIQNSKKFVAK